MTTESLAKQRGIGTGFGRDVGSEAISLARKQILARDGESSLDAYPYANPYVYNFLQDVIENGVLDRVSNSVAGNGDEESSWLRLRNVAGFYYTTDATYMDTAILLGVSNNRQLIHNMLVKFHETIWSYCPKKIKEKYNLDEIKAHLAKPNTIKTLVRKGRAINKGHGGSGKSYFEEPVKPTSKIAESIRINKELDVEMENPPEEYGEKQKMMDRTRRRYFESRRKYFLTSSELIIAAGIGEKGTRRAHKVITVLRRNKIAKQILHEQVVESGRLYHESIVFIHISDEDRAIEAIKNAADYILSS